MFDDLSDKQAPSAGADQSNSLRPVSQAPTPPPIPGESGQSTQTPSTPPVDDMFAESEPVKPAQFQPKAASDSVNTGMAVEKGRRLNKVFVLLAAASAVLAVAIGVYWGLNWFLNKDTESLPSEAEALIADPVDNENIIATDEPADPDTASNAGIVPVEPTPDPINGSENMHAINEPDTDQDGLSDQEELLLGTNINSIDSDSDGLFDREEVRVYKTDPLNPDTDGDGYSDGEEVKGGYNPNGEGKLYDLIPN